MGKISYKSLWEASYKWLTSVKNDVYSSYCKICKKTFRNDGSKWSQVQAHARGNKHLALDPEMKDKSQRTLVMVVGNEVEFSKNDTVLKPEDQITKTEILNTLHDVHNNYSFRSTEDDSKIYAALFPDSERAKNYQNWETKTKYFVQFGIAPYIKEMLIFLILIKPLFLFYLMRPLIHRYKNNMTGIFDIGPNARKKLLQPTVAHFSLDTVIVSN